MDRQPDNTDKRTFMLKRLGGTVLAFCLMVTMTSLTSFATGRAETDEDAGRWGRDLYILGMKISETGEVPRSIVPHEGTIHYDTASRTLTLTNAVLDLDNYYTPSQVTNNYAAAICAWDDITIVLKGENKIVSTTNTYTSDKEYIYGIKNSGGDTTIQGSGRSDSLRINIESVNGKSTTGIDCNRMLYINDCSMDVSMTGEGPSAGIDLFEDFGIDGNAEVTVRASGTGSTAVDGTGMFDGSYITGGSTLTMISDGKAFKCYLPSDHLKDEATAYVNEEAAASETLWDKTTPLASYKYVRFEGTGTGPGRAASSLYLLGRKIAGSGVVSSETVPHEGTISYDADSNTLTLDGAVLDLKDWRSPAPGGNLIAAIYSTSDLKMILAGESSICFTDESYDAQTEYAYGIESYGGLDVSGSGTLNIVLAGAKPEKGMHSAAADGEKASVNIYGIGTDDSMSVEAAMINIDMGDHGKASGMYLWGPIDLTGGAVVRVTSKGSSNYAVNGVNDIAESTVSSDSVLEMTADNIALNCWSAGAGLKKAGAMVNRAATPEGAGIWNKSTWLREYKYVRIPEYDPDDDILPPDDSTPGGGTDKASDRSEVRKAGSDKKVKTGDQNNVEIWYSICLSAAAVLALMTIVRLRLRSARRQKDI